MTRRLASFAGSGLLVLLLATPGCRREAPAAASDAAPPRDTATATGAAVSALPEPIMLPPRLAACAPEASSPWAEVSRTTEGADTLVYIERPDVPPASEWDPGVLRLSKGTCRGYRLYETDSEPSDAAVTPPSDAAWEVLLDGAFAWHVQRAGSVEAFANSFRTGAGAPLVECPPDDDLGPCLMTLWAERFRRAGVAVGPPE